MSLSVCNHWSRLSRRSQLNRLHLPTWFRPAVKMMLCFGLAASFFLLSCSYPNQHSAIRRTLVRYSQHMSRPSQLVKVYRLFDWFSIFSEYSMLVIRTFHDIRTILRRFLRKSSIFIVHFSHPYVERGWNVEQYTQVFIERRISRLHHKWCKLVKVKGAFWIHVEISSNTDLSGVIWLVR